MPTEFTRKGHTYQIKRIDPIGQAILAQRLLPVAVPIFRVIASRSLEQNDTSVNNLVSMLSDFETIVEALEKVPAKDVREIYDACLSRLLRQADNKTGWQVVWNNGTLMFEDIEGFDVIALTIEVVKDQLGTFIPNAMQTFGMSQAA